MTDHAIFCLVRHSMRTNLLLNIKVDVTVWDNMYVTRYRKASCISLTRILAAPLALRNDISHTEVLIVVTLVAYYTSKTLRKGSTPTVWGSNKPQWQSDLHTSRKLRLRFYGSTFWNWVSLHQAIIEAIHLNETGEI